MTRCEILRSRRGCDRLRRQSGQEQLQLRGVQLLALGAENAPGQRGELLPPPGELAAGLFQGLLQGRHLLLQHFDLSWQRGGVHRIGNSDRCARGLFKRARKIFYVAA